MDNPFGISFAKNIALDFLTRVKTMTVRLVKRGQQVENTSKEPEQPSTSQLVLTTRAWVEEFRARKSSSDAALRERVKLG